MLLEGSKNREKITRTPMHGSPRVRGQHAVHAESLPEQYSLLSLWLMFIKDKLQVVLQMTLRNTAEWAKDIILYSVQCTVHCTVYCVLYRPNTVQCTVQA